MPTDKLRSLCMGGQEFLKLEKTSLQEIEERATEVKLSQETQKRIDDLEATIGELSRKATEWEDFEKHME